MTLAQAKKQGLVIEVELDQYLTDDNRVLVYDRYSFGKTAYWVCDGYAYRNFCDAYNGLRGMEVRA